LNPDRLTWIGRTDSGVVRQRLYDRDIGSLGLNPLDPGADVWAKAIRKEGAVPHWWSDPHHYGLAKDGSALAYRKQLDADLSRLALPGEMVMPDLELLSKEYVKRLFFGALGNRGLYGSNNDLTTMDGTQFGRQLGYTNMPFQDSSVVPIDVLVAARVKWFPQGYYGDMSPADMASIVLEIIRWEFPAVDVHPFYDGKLIASDQRDGGWFTAERIPGVFVAGPQIRSLMGLKQPEHFTKDSLRAYYTGLAGAA
jgi:hypothetical protein